MSYGLEKRLSKLEATCKGPFDTLSDEELECLIGYIRDPSSEDHDAAETSFAKLLGVSIDDPRKGTPDFIDEQARKLEMLHSSKTCLTR